VSAERRVPSAHLLAGYDPPPTRLLALGGRDAAPLEIRDGLLGVSEFRRWLRGEVVESARVDNGTGGAGDHPAGGAGHGAAVLQVRGLGDLEPKVVADVTVGSRYECCGGLLGAPRCIKWVWYRRGEFDGGVIVSLTV